MLRTLVLATVFASALGGSAMAHPWHWWHHHHHHGCGWHHHHHHHHHCW